MRTLPRKCLLIVVGTLMAAGCSPAPKGPPTVSGEGFGPVHFGMKVADAETALGVKLAGGGGETACQYYSAADAFPGVAFMTSDGLIVRVDVRAGDTAADTGAKIGDNEEHVVDLYKGRVQVGPHKYTGPQGHYLTVTGTDGKVQMVFETDGSKITSYHAGREPQVQYVEGCS